MGYFHIKKIILYSAYLLPKIIILNSDVSTKQGYIMQNTILCISFFPFTFFPLHPHFYFSQLLPPPRPTMIYTPGFLKINISSIQVLITLTPPQSSLTEPQNTEPSSIDTKCYSIKISLYMLFSF